MMTVMLIVAICANVAAAISCRAQGWRALMVVSSLVAAANLAGLLLWCGRP